MKRITTLIVTVCIILILSSCVDFNVGKRPSDENDVKWISQNPDIWFVVQDNQYYGEITLNGKTTEIGVSFDYGTGIAFRIDHSNSGDDWLFLGRWKYTKGADTFRVNVFNNEKGFLDDSVKTITFTKEDYDTGTRWFDDIDAKFISTDPDIWFVVGSGKRIGELNIDGEITEIMITRHTGSNSWVFNYYVEEPRIPFEQEQLFRVYCRHDIDEFYAYVIESNDDPNFFHEENKIFHRGKVIKFERE
jgi:hypothetical protein